MRPIYQNYEARNEYTSPLEGKPYYRNSGVIYAPDRGGSKYAVSRIDFERYDQQNYQYIPRIWDESEEREMSEEECSILLKLVMLQESLENRQNKQKHRQGIDKAKREGKYIGRKKIAVDQNLLRQVAEDFESKKVTESEAIQRLGITSRSTFYRRMKEVKLKSRKDTTISARDQ